jgi:hypothetical protein
MAQIVYENDLLLRNPSGAVSPKLVFGDADTYFYESADDVLDLYVAGSIHTRFNASGLDHYLTLKVDHIGEHTGSHNVVIDKRLGINTGANTVTDDLMIYPDSSDYTVMSLNNGGVRCFLCAYNATKGYAGTSSNHPFDFYTNNTVRISFSAAGLTDIQTPVTITGTTKTDGYLYAGTSAPSNTTRLNYDGYFYTTRLYAINLTSTYIPFAAGGGLLTDSGLKWNNAQSSLGIGGTPGSNLHVYGADGIKIEDDSPKFVMKGTGATSSPYVRIITNTSTDAATMGWVYDATNPTARFNYGAISNTHICIASSGYVGIGFTAPLSAVCVNGGLHVGGESAAGDNNLIVDGIVLISGTTKTDGYLYAGSSAPSNATRLNYDGYLYATKLYSGGNEVLTGAQHYLYCSDDSTVAITSVGGGGSQVNVNVPIVFLSNFNIWDYDIQFGYASSPANRSIIGCEGVNASNDGWAVIVHGGDAYQTSGNGNGGAVYIHGGKKRGTGTTGQIFLGTGSGGDHPLAGSGTGTSILLYNRSTGEITYGDK